MGGWVHAIGSSEAVFSDRGDGTESKNKQYLPVNRSIWKNRAQANLSMPRMSGRQSGRMNGGVLASSADYCRFAVHADGRFEISGGWGCGEWEERMMDLIFWRNAARSRSYAYDWFVVCLLVGHAEAAFYFYFFYSLGLSWCLV